MQSEADSRSAGEKVLKADLFGEVRVGNSAERGAYICRDTRPARWWLAPVARRLARREARALLALDGIQALPRLLEVEGNVVYREWLPGRPMHEARPRDPAYFRAALRLLARLHRRGVSHNDLAKEANWLVAPDGNPALVDFQLAGVHPRRGRWFRLLAHEDLRHLLKHKRYYCPDQLSARQLRILSKPAWPARIWRASGKRVYLFVTRRLLNWSDREGAGDRWQGPS